MIQETQIRSILEVCKEGNITRAANNIFISQPALSRIIKDTEKRLGIKLFEYRDKKLVPTEEGRRYIEGCYDVLSVYHATLKEINDLKDETTGVIRLGISYQMALFVLPSILGQFREAYPNVRLELVEGKINELENRVRDGISDMAIVYADSNENLSYHYLASDPVYIQVPPVYYSSQDSWNYGFDNKQLDIKDIFGEPFILLKKGRGMRRISDAVFSQKEITPHIVMETDSINLAYELVNANFGFTFIAKTAATMYGKFGSFVCCPVEGMNLSRNIYICTQKNMYLSKASRFLIGLIRNRLAENCEVNFV
ncbi:MAG: LysR family transcriptional regulator [Oscillospiraceae bacterium]|nr:LysR family transcriptional regulator [Oscillospiraceae bacterium]